MPHIHTHQIRAGLYRIERSCLLFVFQTQRYEEEKRSLSREIVTLNKHLMDAKITIQKLRSDNVRTTQKHTMFHHPTGSHPLPAGSPL